jgi:hypothetical protein
MSLVTIAVGLFAPLVVGLLTKTSMPSSVKSVALLFINAAAALGQQYINHPHGSLRTAVITAVTGFVVSVGMHYGLWTKVGLTGVVQGLLVKDPQLTQAPVSATPDAGAVTSAVDAASKALGGSASDKPAA